MISPEIALIGLSHPAGGAAHDSAARHLPLLQLAGRALADAGIDAGSRVAVVVAPELDGDRDSTITDRDLLSALTAAGLALTPAERAALAELDHSDAEGAARVQHCSAFVAAISAGRVASLWSFTGGVHAAPACATSAFHGLETARRLLGEDSADAVLVCAVALTAPHQALHSRGAAVLMRLDRARHSQRRIHALLRSVAIAGPSADALASACSRAHSTGGLAPEALGLLDLAGTGIDGAPDALAPIYSRQGRAAYCALGHTTASGSAMAGLIGAAVALRDRTIPALEGWAPVLTAAGSPFYAPFDSRPWFLEQGAAHRSAGVAACDRDGSAAFVLLAGPQRGQGEHAAAPVPWPLRFVPLAANGERGLLERLENAARALDAGTSVEDLIQSAAPRDGQPPRYTVVLLGANREELRTEIDRALAGIPQSFASGRDWTTPGGSFFTPRPLGGTGKLAFAYPGSSSSYLGLGRTIFRLFPFLLDRLEGLVPDLGAALGADHLYPRTLETPSSGELAARQAALSDDVFSMVASATGYAYLTTAVLRECLGLQPDMAFGYSIGESVMLRALGAWPLYHQPAVDGWHKARMTQRISGPREAARAYPPTAQSSWETYLLLASPQRVREALCDRRDVFLTMINTPKEVCIAGSGAACASVIAALGCEHTRAPFNYVLHSLPIESAYEDLARIHRHPTTAVPEIAFYTSAGCAPLALSEETTARTVASMICRPLDFSALVERLYADGARLFVELGPAGACSRWIHEILGDREHMTVSCNSRAVEDGAGLLRAAARLLSHGLPLNTALLTGDVLPAAPALSPQIEVPAGPVTRAHRALLRARGEGLEQAQWLITLQLDAAQRWLSEQETAPGAVSLLPAPGRPIWSEADLLEFARGSVATVFGPAYTAIDGYRRRMRLPLPPYLLVSRVTQISGTPGALGPATITTEYDIPHDAWYAVDGQIPWAIAVESGQGHMLLLSYLGLDFESRGERVWRLLHFTWTFLGPMARVGQTLRYEISVHSYARSGDALLVFFSYLCFAGDTLILRMEGGCGGLFSDHDLEQGRGIVTGNAERLARESIVPRRFTPLLSCGAARFDRQQLLALSAGDPAGCFGAGYDLAGRNASLRLPQPSLLLLDRVLAVDPRGGAWGLGMLTAEKDLHSSDWYFACHFQDDHVLPGSLMVEGCAQLLQFYLLYLGLHTQTRDARFQPLQDRAQAVRCRGQIPPDAPRLRYSMEITEIGLAPSPYAVATVDILSGDRIVLRIEGLGLALVEAKPAVAAPVSALPEPVAPMQPRRTALFDERQITELSSGSVVACFGDDYAVFQTRRVPRIPNGDLQLMSRAVELNATRRRPEPGSSLTAEYDVPANPWYYRQHGSPSIPYSILMEIALQPCGFLSGHIGTTLGFPDEDFYYRNLDGRGLLHREIDLRGKTITNQIELRASSAVQGAVIESFAFRLSCDGVLFYEGSAVFGYFSAEALAHQVGLDRGERVPAWLEEHEAGQRFTVDLHSPEAAWLYGGDQRSTLRLGDEQFELLDTLTIVTQGGSAGLGYVHATRQVRSDDWFFSAHFYQDPVMPGSLGIEAMLQSLKAFALATGLGAELSAPHFASSPGREAIWKYRGQILPTDRQLSLEVHVEAINHGDGWVEVTGSGSVWRSDLRIYAVQGLAVRVQAGGER